MYLNGMNEKRQIYKNHLYNISWNKIQVISLGKIARKLYTTLIDRLAENHTNI